MNRTYRSRDQAVFAALIGGGTCLGFVAWGLIPKGYSLEDRLFAVGMGLFFGSFYILRLARTGVRTSNDGITILNPLQTRKLAWTEVKEFDLGRFGIYPRVGKVELMDGTRIKTWGIQGPNPLFRPKRAEAESLIEELNRELTRRRDLGGFEKSSGTTPGNSDE